MWCTKCDRSVLECQCPDIDNVDRLQELYDYGLGLAAQQVVNDRRGRWSSDIVEKDAT